MRTLFRRILALLRLAPGREQLSYLLENADPKASLEERVLWLERLIYWIKSSSVTSNTFDESTGQLHAVRMRFIFHLLQRNEEWKSRVAATLRSLLLDTDTVNLFCQAGLARERGFIFEAFDRALHRFLPSPPRYDNAAELFQRVFTSHADAVWMENLPSEVTLRIVELVRFGVKESDESPSDTQGEMIEALAILGSQIAAAGTSVEIRARLPGATAMNSPFVLLNERILGAVGNFREKEKLTPTTVANLKDALPPIQECRRSIQKVFDHLEKSGVSVSLVYLLERQLSALTRTETMIQFITTRSPRETHRLVTTFFAALIREQVDRQSLRGLLRSNLHLLSRKISERAGASGEHYITHNRKEYFEMLRSAAGGGAITVGTALGKFIVSAMKAPLFFDGLFTSLVYAGSFLLMQLFGFALATKQPSMTAAAIAGKLEDIDREGGIRAFVTEVACLTRSQFAAAVGNIGIAVPGAVLFDYLFRKSFGHSFLTIDYAEHVWEAHHPFKSLSIWYGALTGVLLFSSSIFAGWLENFVVLHEIPEAIAQSRRLRQVFGDKLPRKLADKFLHGIAGIGGNVSIGFLLGSTHVVGRFFGAPLEVRHLTLSATTLGFAVSAIAQRGLEAQDVLWPIASVVCIGIMNFGVSFALALFVAVRARNVKAETLMRIAEEVGRRFRKSPLEFFYAER